MLDTLGVLAVIPARRGSRGIPGKNLRLLAGRPLIHWTIDAALNSEYVDRVVVSTDDSDVKDIARERGVSVIDRPASIAGDHSTSAQVIAHALEQDPAEGFFVYLQPTSPLRTFGDIDSCLELLSRGDCEGVVSVVETVEHPEWMYRLDENDLSLTPVIESKKYPRRQDLPRAVKLNGAVYCAGSEFLRPDGDFFRLRLLGFDMPQIRSLDIDVIEDLEAAETLLTSSGKVW